MRPALLKYLLFGLFLAAAYDGKAIHYFVDSSATAGANNGTSWFNAYRNLQTAIRAASSGDTLWVADGHYYPGNPGENDAWLDLKIGVTMLGGFQGLDGAQETSASQRNHLTNQTILSGDLDRNGIHSAGDAYHVVNSTQKDTTAVVDGFIIEMGYAVGPGGHSFGAGIFSFGGGGSYYNCVIRDNRSNGRGGGMFAYGNFKFRRCLFIDNQSGTEGGAIAQPVRDLRIQVHNCAFVNNTADIRGGALFSEAANFQLLHCTFKGNAAPSGSAIFTVSDSMNIRNSIFWGNTGPDLALLGVAPIVNRCIIEGGFPAGRNILDVDPLFRDTQGRIYSCSPAVDAGDTLPSIAQDLDGSPRPFDGDVDGIGKWDLGAFEVQVPQTYPAANAIMGPSPGCARSFGNTYQVATDNAPGNTYRWTLSGGGNLPGSTADPSVAVNWGSALGTYRLTVVETNALTGCTTTNSVDIPLMAPPAVTLIPNGNDSICSGDTVLVTASATGVSRQWYRNGTVVPGATAPAIRAASAGYYNQVVTGSNGCADSAATGFRLYLRPLPVVAFTTNIPLPICRGGAVTISGSPGAAYQWYRNQVPLEGATGPRHTTGTAGVYNMRLTDVHGCRDSAAAGLEVVVNPLPTVVLTLITPDTICIGDSLPIAASTSNPVSYQWYRDRVALPNGNVNPHHALASGWYNCRVTDSNHCVDSAAVGGRLVVDDFVNPVALCRDVTVYLEGGGTVPLSPAMLDNGSSDDCKIASLALSPSSMACANLGTHPVALTVADLSGRTGTCISIVTVRDTLRPTAVCVDTHVYLDGNGELALHPDAVGGGNTDNCSIVTRAVVPSFFTCADTGARPVTFTATDASGNSSSCLATVHLADSTRPAALCTTATVYLDGHGIAAITAASVDRGSADNCGLGAVAVSRTSLDCADVPGVLVGLTVRDISGNVAACQAYVRVIDSVPPVPHCRDTTLYIGSTGVASLTPEDLDRHSSDDCVIDSIWISQGAFTCADTGTNEVLLSMTDADTNLSACISRVTILDTIPPRAVCTDTTFFLDAAGFAAVDPAVFGIKSEDNCSFFDTAYVRGGPFNCTQTGPHPVELFVVDVMGRVDSCSGTVILLDGTPPIALCRDISPVLPPTGTVTVTTAQVDNGTTDNCTLATLTLSQASFTCANAGVNTVVLTATDSFGNSSTCASSVTVTDTVPPTPRCRDHALYLDGSGTASMAAAAIDGGSSDDCAVSGRTLSRSAFTCEDAGAHIVTLTVTDAYGNARTCSSVVTVLDTIPPVATCQNFTASLDASGSYTLLPPMIDGGSSDNCSIAIATASPSAFTCSDIGVHAVTLTVTDPSGLHRSCGSLVSIQDTTAPTPGCVRDTFYLDDAGGLSLTVSDLAAGYSDDCEVSSAVLSQSAFNCTDLGATPVTVTFSDPSANTSSCEATVTVQDTVKPTAQCLHPTLILNGAGTATLSVSQVNDGSSDACGVMATRLGRTSFSCNDLGSNSVILSVMDSSGNVGTCLSAVTVLDTLEPAMACAPATVGLDANGNFLLLGSLLGGGSDVCGIDTVYAVPFMFDCRDIGVNAVTVFARDPAGNLDSCKTSLTLQDHLAPLAICDTIDLQLGSSGTAVLTPQMLGPGSSDNCGLDSLGLSRSTFSCADRGWASVTLTLTDAAGNSSSCIGQVHIVDTSGISAVGVHLGPDTSACIGDTLTFSAPSGMGSYSWSTGGTGASISVSAAGTYWVRVTSPLGCEGRDTIVLASIILDDPHLRSESGELAVCLNDTLRLLVDEGFTSYQWSTGSTESHSDVYTGGNFSVRVADENGCSLLRTVYVDFAPFPPPHPVVTPGGTVGMCENTSVQLDVGPGYYAYLWTTGQTSSRITAYIPGTYSVQVWNGFGCHSVSAPVTVVSLPSPYPGIQRSNDTLFTTAAANFYQWYLGAVPILGATGSRYLATLNGSYTVRAYYANGCHQLSNPLPFLVGMQGGRDALGTIQVFPVPSDGRLKLRTDVPIARPLKLQVADVFGRSAGQFSFRGLQDEIDMDLTPLPAGIYLMKISSGGASTVRKIVIE